MWALKHSSPKKGAKEPIYLLDSYSAQLVHRPLMYIGQFTCYMDSYSEQLVHCPLMYMPIYLLYIFIYCTNSPLSSNVGQITLLLMKHVFGL